MINWHKTFQDFVEPLDTYICKTALEETQRILSSFPDDTADMQSMYQVALMSAGDIVLDVLKVNQKAVKLCMTNASPKSIAEAKKIALSDVGKLKLSDIRGSMIYWQSMYRELLK